MSGIVSGVPVSVIVAVSAVPAMPVIVARAGGRIMRLGLACGPRAGMMRLAAHALMKCP